MTVSKELAKTVMAYESAKKCEDILFKGLSKWAYDNDFDGSQVTGFGISEEPQGEKQENGTYCIQTFDKGCGGIGICYYPIEDSELYMRVSYVF